MYQYRLVGPKRPERRFRRLYGLTHHCARKQWALLSLIFNKYPTLWEKLKDEL